MVFNVQKVPTDITCGLGRPAAPVCCSSRYGLALLSCYGFFVVYSLRVNLSVAMVDMLNSTHQSGTNGSGSVCPAHPSPERPKHNHTVSKNASTALQEHVFSRSLLMERVNLSGGIERLIRLLDHGLNLVCL